MTSKSEIIAPVLTVAPPESGANPSAIMRLVEKATLDSNFDVAKLEHLLAVQERWQANAARQAFVAAKALFRADAPTIVKDKLVGYTSKSKGGNTNYTHASLGNTGETLAPALAKHGFDFSWELDQLDGGMVSVTCILTHKEGHSQRATLRASLDTSGSKNSIQSLGSTVTYLERYTLQAVTGTATKNADNGQWRDDDGRASESVDDKITAAQKKHLIEAIKDTGADTEKFLVYLDIPNIDSLPAARFQQAKHALEAKRARA